MIDWQKPDADRPEHARDAATRYRFSPLYSRSSARSPVLLCDDRAMEDLVTAAIAVVTEHPAVQSVEFSGSRARGTHEQLSDWDFAVKTSDFDSVSRDLPTLVAPLHPLAEQWEPLGHFPVYQVMLRGPTKVEYLFLECLQDPVPPVGPSKDTLDAINTHFWDWIWWLATKQAAGRDDLVAEHLAELYRHLLGPMGVDTKPEELDAAIRAFLARRNALEHEYGMAVPRRLENEIRRGIERIRQPSRSTPD
jgi:hypothetical protein